MKDHTWMPIIHTANCNGCGLCIAACPTKALGWRDGKAALVNPEVCIYCATCEDICPTAAIELPYLVVMQADKTEPPYSPAHEDHSYCS